MAGNSLGHRGHRVGTQHPQFRGAQANFFQHRSHLGLVTMALEVDEEDVVPHTGARGPRFDTRQIDLVAMETPRQLAALDDGSLDLGFLRPRSHYPDGIETRFVHEDDVLLAMTPRHRLAHGRIDAATLATERFIVPQFDEQDGFGERLQQLSRHGGFEPGPILRVRDFVTAVTLAAAGYGLALVPRSVTALSLSGVVYRPISGFTGTVRLVAAWRRNNGSAVLQALVARLAATPEAST